MHSYIHTLHITFIQHTYIHEASHTYILHILHINAIYIHSYIRSYIHLLTYIHVYTINHTYPGTHEREDAHVAFLKLVEGTCMCGHRRLAGGCTYIHVMYYTYIYLYQKHSYIHYGTCMYISYVHTRDCDLLLNVTYDMCDIE